MRVLVTGCTSQQCGSGTQLDYEPVADLFVKALRHGGHDVDVRPYAPDGELVKAYDRVVVGLVPVLSVAGKYVNYALSAIYDAEDAGVPLTLFVDDWRFPRFVTNLGTCERMPHQLTKDFFGSRAGHEGSKDPLVHETLMTVIKRLRHDPWPTTVIPAYAWGDHGKLTSKLPNLQTVHTVDPTVFCRDYDIPIVDERKREWVLGTVSDQRGWVEKLAPTWDVRYLGGRASKATEKLKEKDLVAAYGGSWGVLSPYYSQVAGTGWWRNRFVYAAAAGAILWCDPREAPRLGRVYGTPLHEIERATERDLGNLAHEQREALIAFTPSANLVAKTWTEALG